MPNQPKGFPFCIARTMSTSQGRKETTGRKEKKVRCIPTVPIAKSEKGRSRSKVGNQNTSRPQGHRAFHNPRHWHPREHEHRGRRKTFSFQINSQTAPSFRDKISRTRQREPHRSERPPVGATDTSLRHNREGSHGPHGEVLDKPPGSPNAHTQTDQPPSSSSTSETSPKQGIPHFFFCCVCECVLPLGCCI